MKISIVYWSGTGNTQKMAELIEEGATGAGAQVTVKPVSQAMDDDILKADISALGCPAMGDEVLEETEFEPFMTKLEKNISGKKLALFGSYDWGDGLWMRDWLQRMTNAGAILTVEQGLTVKGMPEGENARECVEFGRKLASG